MLRCLIIVCIVLAVSLSFLTGCIEKKDNEAIEDASLITYSNEVISFQYPDWPDVSSEEDNVFLLKSNGSSIFSAARYPVPSSLLIDEMEKNLGVVFEGEYVYYKYNSENTEMNAVTRVLFTGYETYTLTIMSTEQPDASLLSSAKRKARVLNTRERVGIMPIPVNGDASFLPQACREARDLGAGVISWYFFWGGLEEDWSVADYVMECLSHEGRSVVVMNVIHTNVLGQYPPKFESFEDPGFKEAFADFSVAFIERYKPDCYFIGGEVDIYLNMHRHQLPAFREMLGYVYREIKKAGPETQVGLVVTYHYARDFGALDIIRTLAPDSDIIGYTVHPYEGDYLYHDVSRGLEYLNEVPDVVPGKPFAIIETGWSSSALLESSEEKQVEFVHDFFSFVDNSDAEFTIWFCLHDLGDCSEAAKTHLGVAPELQLDEAYVEAFEEFMCSPGLKNPDGLPKKAWYTWQQYIQAKE